VKTKNLKVGAAVEVKLDMSDCLEKWGDWEPAVYGQPTVMPGWHRVMLERNRRINAMTGRPTTADDRQSYLINTAIVHAARIRLPKEKKR
jgi:hypothetical protein